MNKNLKNLFAFFGRSKNQSNNEMKEWYDEQKHKLETSEEIEPPWVIYNPEMSPWELRHESWLIDIWLPFWRNMDEEKREDYRKKWNMPDDWYEVITRNWTDID